MLRSLFFLCASALCACFLAGCVPETLPQGIVATVDGKPIALRTVQTMQDTRTAGLGAFDKPSVATLRQQYGAALTSLIAYQLILQELEARGMAVTEEAVNEAEARVRQDYLDEEFEKNLAESAIDLDSWRELMRYRIAVILFTTQVLRPTLSVSLKEVEEFYTAREKEFIIPRTLTLYQVIGADRDKVQTLHESGDIPEDSPDLNIYRVHMNRESLPVEWRKKIAALKPGQCTDIQSSAGKHEYVCLMGETPERKMNVAEAYPYIEEILLEEKLETAFQLWLEKRLQKAQVRVSTHLIDEIRGREQ